MRGRHVRVGYYTDIPSQWKIHRAAEGHVPDGLECAKGSDQEMYYRGEYQSIRVAEDQWVDMTSWANRSLLVLYRGVETVGLQGQLGDGEE
jgi:hypothetical protein